MKQALLVIFLGFALVALTACTGNRSRQADSDDKQGESAKVSVDDKGAEGPVLLLDGSYQLDPANSQLTWHGEKVIGKGHTGTVAFQSGDLQVQDNSLSAGQFVIDLSSLKNDENIASLDNHLKSADFFDVANYPTAQLVITGIEAGEDGRYKISADLSIKDVTAPVNFEAKLAPTVNGLSASAQFEIDRTVWGLKYGSGKFFQDLGDNMINDDIVFTVNLQAVRAN
ncbi:MAG: YceI family protein [Patescibacteria group bacterium]|nr:YceI family protein [Patescibacteria group bacterium]